MNSALHIPRSALEWCRELQFAVDGLWLAGKNENARIRREFGLPADKAFKG